MRSDHWQSEAAFFDQVAAQHRAALRPIDPLALKRYSSRILRRRFGREFRFGVIGNLRGLRILDVGCGEGSDTVLLARLGAGHVTGVDISPGAISLARDRAALNGVSERVDFVCAPVETAPLAEHSYDVIWCSAILHHLTDNLDLVIRRLCSYCKPGGLLTFAEPVNFNWTLRRLRLLVPLRRTDVTDDERPLEERDLAAIRRHIPDLRERRYALLGRLDQFLLRDFNYERSSSVRRAAVNVTAALDWCLLSLPALENLASTSVMWGHAPRTSTF